MSELQGSSLYVSHLLVRHDVDLDNEADEDDVVRTVVVMMMGMLW